MITTDEVEPPYSPEADPLPCTALEQAIIDSVAKLKGRPKHCAFNAIKRIKRAWLIRQIDPEMAAFSALTAHEEAATALIFALKAKQYKGATGINHRLHPHKTGLIYMIVVVHQHMSALGFPPVTWIVRKNMPAARIDVEIDGTFLGKPGTSAALNEPLNFQVAEAGQPNGSFNFMELISDIVSGNNADSFEHFIRVKANERNNILYASDEGIPTALVPDSFLREQFGIVIKLIAATILVLQAPGPQLFANQMLRIYLNLIGKPWKT